MAGQDELDDMQAKIDDAFEVGVGKFHPASQKKKLLLKIKSRCAGETQRHVQLPSCIAKYKENKI
eukprot:754086-Hanusia_phi.AAC.7